MNMRLKATLVGGACLAGVFSFSEAARAENLDEILECRAIAEDIERLRCFDNTTESAAENIASAGAEPGGDRPSAVQVASDESQSPDDSFGAEDLAQKRSKEQESAPKALHAKLVGLRFTNAGRYIITLDNGQVWRQITGDTDNLRLPRATGDGIPIIIKKGLLGSHKLRPASSKRSIRVERVK